MCPGDSSSGCFAFQGANAGHSPSAAGSQARLAESFRFIRTFFPQNHVSFGEPRAFPHPRNADQSVFRERSGEAPFSKRRPPTLSSSACPAGSRWCRQRLPSIRRESCGLADLGRSNLWRPMVVARIGGSRCVQAQPALPTGKSFGEAGNGSLRGEINTDTY